MAGGAFTTGRARRPARYLGVEKHHLDPAACADAVTVGQQGKGIGVRHRPEHVRFLTAAQSHEQVPAGTGPGGDPPQVQPGAGAAGQAAQRGCTAAITRPTGMLTSTSAMSARYM